MTCSCPEGTAADDFESNSLSDHGELRPPPLQKHSHVGGWSSTVTGVIHDVNHDITRAGGISGQVDFCVGR